MNKKLIFMAMIVLAVVLAACSGSSVDTSALDSEIAGLQEQLAEANAALDEAKAVAADAGGAVEAITFAGGGDTLAEVQARGVLNCGVSGTLPGFSFVEEDGSISGFDWDYCRVIAAAVLGNADAVEPRPATSTERFPILQSGINC